VHGHKSTPIASFTWSLLILFWYSEPRTVVTLEE